MYLFDKLLPRKPELMSCIAPRFWRDEETGETTQCPCYGTRCPCCAVFHRRREAAILKKSFQTLPPDVAVTLSYHPRARVSSTELSGHFRAWSEALRHWGRKRGVKLLKKKTVEFASGRPHIHVTLIFIPKNPDLDAAKLLPDLDLEQEWRPLWKAAAGHKAANGFYAKAVCEPMAWASYIAKHLAGEKGEVELPPVGWRGRLTSSSPGFLSKPKDVLYDEVKAGWGFEPKRKGQKVARPRREPHVHRPWQPGGDVEVFGTTGALSVDGAAEAVVPAKVRRVAEPVPARPPATQVAHKTAGSLQSGFGRSPYHWHAEAAPVRQHQERAVHLDGGRTARLLRNWLRGSSASVGSMRLSTFQGEAIDSNAAGERGVVRLPVVAVRPAGSRDAPGGGLRGCRRRRLSGAWCRGP